MEILSSTLGSLLAMLVTLGILVTIHEYGHFIIARVCGVKVERFSIGFGKPLLRWKGKVKPKAPGRMHLDDEEPTEFVISVLPLGGYVKMLGEQEHEIDPALRDQAFNFKPLYQRTAIVAAGPIANFLLAIVLYWAVFMAGVSGLAPVVGDVEPDGSAAQAGLQAGDEFIAIDNKATSTWQDARLALLDRLGESGELIVQVKNQESTSVRELHIPITDWLSDTDEPDLLGALGMSPYHMVVPPLINEVIAGERAEAAGIRKGDTIITSDGVEVRTWNMWLNIIRTHPEQTLTVSVERDGQIFDTTMTPAVRLAENGEPELDADGKQQGYIGAAVFVPQMPAWMNRSVSYSPVTAFTQALRETGKNSLFILVSIKKMLVGDISVKNLSGPITIAQVAGETASSGLEYYVSFLALLSISLGVLNLLPIPVLDGGHLFYYAIEALIRRPVPRRMQEIGMQVGMMLVACIMFLALFNDVNRLF